MGRGGPRPKSPHELAKAGNPGHRPITGDAAWVPKGSPRMPKNLPAAVKREWKRICRTMAAAGTLSNGYGQLLLTWSLTVVELAAAEKTVAGLDKPTCEGAKGGLYLHPAIGHRNALRAQVLKLAVEMGLTPAARGGAKQTPQADGEKPKGKGRFFTKQPATIKGDFAGT